MNNHVKNILGQKFGRLIVIEFAGTNKGRNASWKCECDCGNIKVIRSSSLLAGVTKSCGCLLIEVASRRTVKPGVTSFKLLIHNYRIKAKNRNINFDLTKEEFYDLTKQKCHYCGRQPSQSIHATHSGSPYIYNGIDRVDSQKGYTKNNCVAACKYCNSMKRTLSVGQFITHVKAIVAYQTEV